MDPETARIKVRLEEVLTSIYCPILGCWPARGCHYEFYYDSGCDRHVLEVWPIKIEDADEPDEIGHTRNDRGTRYELAEFEFSKMVRHGPLDHFHFSQHRAMFEIGWEESGSKLELRVHIEPIETGGVEFMEG